MHTYDKKQWPYQFRMLPEPTAWETNAPDAWDQMCRLEAYCIDNFDRGTWRNNGLYFGFKRSEDATLFALRWMSEGS
jgi:hypothetical protein